MAAARGRARHRRQPALQHLRCRREDRRPHLKGVAYEVCRKGCLLRDRRQRRGGAGRPAFRGARPVRPQADRRRPEHSRTTRAHRPAAPWRQDREELPRARRGELDAYRGAIKVEFSASARNADRIPIRVWRKFLRHQDLVVILAVVFERVLFDPVFHKAEASIQPARLLVADHDAQLDQLDTWARKRDYRLDQTPRNTSPSRIWSNIHAPKQALMRLLLAAPNGEPGDSQDLGTTKRAKYLRAVQSVEEPSQRLCEFSLERAAK